MMKQCSKCGQIKPLHNFYKRGGLDKNYRSSCKDCMRGTSLGRWQTLHDTDPEWREAEKNRIKLQARKKRRIYPEKSQAVTAARKFREEGKELHHWSYLPEHRLDFLVITRDQHYLLHRKMFYDQGRMMYRSHATGVLLDSKQKHIDLLTLYGGN